MDAIDVCVNLGCTAIEINCSKEHADLGVQGIWPWELKAEEKVRLRDKLSAFSSRGLHAAMGGICYLIRNPRIREASLSIIEDTIRLCRELHAHYVVFHASPPAYGISEDSVWSEQIEVFHRLAEVAKENCVVLALENYSYVSSLPELEKILREVNSPNFGATLDVAHAFLRHKEEEFPNIYHEIESFVQSNINRIVSIHIHDYDSARGDHRQLGTGNIDYKKVFGFLGQSKCFSPLISEVNMPSLGEVEIALERINELIADCTEKG